MNKLYRKNEITFAIIWIVIYVVGTSIADSAAQELGVIKSVTAVFHIALVTYLWFWVKKQGLQDKYGFCKPVYPAAKFLFYLPLAVIATCSLWFGVRLNVSVLETVLFVISMLCVGFLEELIFRGFLFRAMEKDNVTQAIIVSSLTFGIGHIVNLFNASGKALIATIHQIIFAAAMGFLLVMIFYRGRSLWPCIIFHGVNNALSIFADGEASLHFFGSEEKEAFFGTGFTLVIAVLYIIILRRTLREKGKD